MTNALFNALFAPHTEKADPFILQNVGPSISYREFHELTCQFSNMLGELGIAPGERIAAQIQKSHHAIALYAACVQAGVVYLPLNIAYTLEELKYYIHDCEAKLLIVQDGTPSSLSHVSETVGVPAISMYGGSTNAFFPNALLMTTDFQPVERGEDDIAALLYTSGTTGRSKGAMLTHGNLISNARALSEFWHFSKSDVLLHALPLFHTHGLFVAVNVTLTVGSSILLLEKFNVDDVIGCMPRTTVMMGVPTHYVRMLKDDRLTKQHAKGIRVFISGSAPLPEVTQEEFFRRTGHMILQRYGMTETNMIASNPYSGARRAGSVGVPLPDIQIRIDTPEGAEKPGLDFPGEIEVKGPNVFKGYWRMPGATASSFCDDGFFRTGDLGYIDEDGYLSIVGRKSDMIISGGYNIYPKEVEDVLAQHSGVQECAVVGLHSEDLGEIPVGVVVPKTAVSLDIEDLLLACRDRLARYKVPRKIVLVNELPRNAMGKVQKMDIQKQLRALELR